MLELPILLTGAGGQLGRVLYKALAEKYGQEHVIATDIKPSTFFHRFQQLDILDKDSLEDLIERENVKSLFHLAAILSATGESFPEKAWKINMTGFLSVLQVAFEHNVDRFFFPSSIAVFGENIPLDMTPQHVPLYPSTVYGISKAAGENWCNYYFTKYGMDVRSLRYPGIIGHQTMPGGGTTDYAVDIFHRALDEGKYQCFLRPDEALPMIYMDDAVRATIELMEAPPEVINVRISYNLGGMSFSPEQLAAAIKRHIPEFEITYEPDFRQEIAESWPNSIDDSHAREDWGWNCEFDLNAMTKDMMINLRASQQ